MTFGTLDGSGALILGGVALNDATGASVAGNGDVNDDGLVDLFIGAPGVSSTTGDQIGAAYVVFGDDTPPVIDATVTGTLGTNGWYVSDVGIEWSVDDALMRALRMRGDGRHHRHPWRQVHVPRRARSAA